MVNNVKKKGDVGPIPKGKEGDEKEKKVSDTVILTDDGRAISTLDIIDSLNKEKPKVKT